MKDSASDRIFNIANTTIVTIFFLAVAYPLIFVVSASFSSAVAVIQGKVWLWPVGFNLEGYKAVFRHEMILSGYANSLFYMTAGTAVNVVLTLMAAYALSR